MSNNFHFPTRRVATTTLVVGLLLTMYGCASVPSTVSVTDTIAKEPSLSTLNGLITSAGLGATLKDGGPFTVFAPNNDAFKVVPAKTMDELSKNPAKLKDVLTFHVVAGKSMASGIKNSKVKSLQGAELEISKSGDFVTLENAAVTKADIDATNGVVHIIDAVLIPPVKK